MHDLTMATTDDDEKLIAMCNEKATDVDFHYHGDSAAQAHAAWIAVRDRLSGLKAQVEHWRTTSMHDTARADRAESELEAQAKVTHKLTMELTAERDRLREALTKAHDDLYLNEQDTMASYERINAIKAGMFAALSPKQES